MRPFLFYVKRWRGILSAISFIILVFLAIRTFVLANSAMHHFEGKCQLCHVEIPEAGTPFEKIVFKDSIDRLCENCHKINQRTSHPVNMRPKNSIPLQRYLDKEGNMTCITCHDVHKEEKGAFDRQGLKGLLRGHTQGRYFCFVCHNDKVLGAKWRHSLVVTYAHSTDRLSQKQNGSILDEFSVECLSCHDGVVSRMNPVEVKSGDFKHGIGLSHPVGIEYPLMGRENEFVSRNILPAEVKLFDGKVGCLSCHNPYGDKKSLLVMENDGSALCLTCHRK